MPDLVVPSRNALMERDRIGVPFRLKDPSYEHNGHLVVVSEWMDWVIIYIVPQASCTSCLGTATELEIPATMCGACFESWSWDHEFNAQPDALGAIAWMLGRIV